MLNAIWIGMVLLAILWGAWTGNLAAVSKASVDSAGAAVTLAIGLVGAMAFWLGMMRILQQGGLLRAVAAALRPLMRRLFPEVPPDHPAMSMMILNFTSNILGLANAATPFGLKAMMELDKLNPKKGTATNAMALFLAINTSGLAVLPTGMIVLRGSLGSSRPGAIIVTTLIATMVSTLSAILLTKLIVASRLFPEPKAELALADRAAALEGPGAAGAPNFDKEVSEAMATIEKAPPPAPGWQRLVGILLALVLVGALVTAFLRRLYPPAGSTVAPESVATALQAVVSDWMLVILIGGFVLYGLTRGVKVYDAIVEGGKEGFNVALRIIPFLVTILVAIGMLRASGAITMMTTALEPLTSLIGMPAEVLPMALLRPLSGSGAYAVAAETMKVHGPDSLIGTIVSTIQGSSETTFYVLAVYFGVVQVRNTRYTLIPCLAAEVAGVLASVWLCRLLLF